MKPIEIVEIVAARFGVEPEALSGSVGRLSAESKARTLATYLLRRHTQASNREIGSLLGIAENSCGKLVAEMAERAQAWRNESAPVAVLCELVERDIDQMHDERPLPPPSQPKKQKTPTCPQCGARRHLSQVGATA